MIITLLSSLTGFLSAALPEVIGYFKDRQDKAHELALLELQIASRSNEHLHRMEEVGASADIAETRALIKTYHSGIRWVDALNATVRPVITYAFFLLYTCVKIAQASLLMEPTLPWHTPMIGAEIFVRLWTLEDQAIFAGIISFYFGQRAMNKIRR